MIIFVVRVSCPTGLGSVRSLWPEASPSTSSTLKEVCEMSRNKRLATRKGGLAIAALAVLGFVVGVGPAQAYHAAVQTVAGSSTTPAVAKVTSYKFKGVVLGGKASDSDIDTGKVTVLSDVMLSAGVKITIKQGSSICHWNPGGGWNSGHDANGKLEYFWDPIPAEVCPSKASPTGWVKVAGGQTGRKCFNPYKVGAPPKHAIIVRGKVLLVRSFVNAVMQLRATASVSLTAVCGFAKASGSSAINVRLSDYIKSKGPTKSSLYANAVGKATANAKAQLSCTVAVTTPPTTTVITGATTVTTPSSTTTVPGTTTIVTPGTTTVITTPSSTTTVPGTTTVVTTTTPASPTCTFDVKADKSSTSTAIVTVTASAAPSTNFVWGDGTSASGTTTATHTYPAPAASNTPGAGSHYSISATATISGQSGVVCKTQSGGNSSSDFFIPAPPLSNGGSTNPPPQPGG